MTVHLDPAEVKSCCSTAYGSDAIELLLGASYHPGGLRLSRDLVERLGVTPQDRLLDVASGRGTTALMISQEYQATVVGVDLSEANVKHAQALALGTTDGTKQNRAADPADSVAAKPVGDEEFTQAHGSSQPTGSPLPGASLPHISEPARSDSEDKPQYEDRPAIPTVEFRHGDAEALPVGDGEFDVVVSECAFCTFPDKPSAAAEFARALRRGGRLGITDMTAEPSALPPELTGLAAWVACIADARPTAEYGEILESAGLIVTATTDHSGAVATMIDRIEARLAVARMAMPEQVEEPGITPGAAKSVIGAARQAVADGTLGYSMILAEKP